MLGLRAALLGRRGLLRALALGLGRGLALLLLGLGLALALEAVALGGVLALLGGELGLQALALLLLVGALLLELGLGLALLGLGGLTAGGDLGVDLRLLEAPLAGEVVVAQRGAGGLLGPAGDLAQQAARRLLGGVRSLGQ